MSPERRLHTELNVQLSITAFVDVDLLQQHPQVCLTQIPTVRMSSIRSMLVFISTRFLLRTISIFLYPAICSFTSRIPLSIQSRGHRSRHDHSSRQYQSRPVMGAARCCVLWLLRRRSFGRRGRKLKQSIRYLCLFISKRPLRSFSFTSASVRNETVLTNCSYKCSIPIILHL